MLNVCEIFCSIQGESARAGLLCSFVRLAGCNLRCAWCDTKYSYDNSRDYAAMTISGIMREVERHGASLVEITGGEPLLQPRTVELCETLVGSGYETLLETNGTLDIGVVPKGVRRVIDVKCPGSGTRESFFMDNLRRVTPDDELKFVLASIDDAEWAAAFCGEHGLTGRCRVAFSPVSSRLSYKTLADWMIKNRLGGVTLGTQLHKIIWGGDAASV